MAITVRDKDGYVVMTDLSYDPEEHPGPTPGTYWFPAADVGQGTLPASGAPYTVEVSPDDYSLSATFTWGDGSVKRFEMMEGAG